MALTKDQKTAQITELRDMMKDAKSMVFMHYRGLSVAEVDDLRGKILEKNAKMKVAKKTLFKIAAKEEGLPEVSDDTIDGPIAIVFSFEDEVSGAKAAFEFKKVNDAVELTGGILNGQVLSKEEATELAKMLSREEMLAKVIGMMKSPLNSFAGMCGGPLRGFVQGLKQVAEKGGVGGSGEDVADNKEEDSEESEESDDSEEKESSDSSESSASSESSEDPTTES